MALFHRKPKAGLQFVDPTSAETQMPMGIVAPMPNIPAQETKSVITATASGPPEISHATSALPMSNNSSTPIPIPIMVKTEPEFTTPSITLPGQTTADTPAAPVGGLDITPRPSSGSRPAGQP